MIYFGEFDKEGVIAKYCQEHDIHKVWSVGQPVGDEENVSYSRSIEYDEFYRFRSSIAADDLIVLNEILINQNRNDLHYNCIRQYVIQTKHRIAFQQYPLGCVEVLSDMMQDNPFLKEPYNAETVCNLPELTIKFEQMVLEAEKVEKYLKAKEEQFKKLKGSPAVLPKQCLKHAQKLTGGDDKATFKPDGHYVISQLGVDHYFYDLLRKQMEQYNEYKDLYGRNGS